MQYFSNNKSPFRKLYSNAKSRFKSRLNTRGPTGSPNLLQLDVFLALLAGAAQGVDHLEGGVEIETTEAVAQIEQVHAGLALKVIDVKGEFGAWNQSQLIKKCML